MTRALSSKRVSLPATFELEPETDMRAGIVEGEATGIVYPYCSLECQQADLSNITGPVSVEDDGGEMMAGCDCCCEGCGVEL